jgi:hypothetical protein
MLDKFALTAASAPLARALLRDARTIEDRIPMMAITTKSSMSVKPLSLFMNDISK